MDKAVNSHAELNKTEKRQSLYIVSHLLMLALTLQICTFHFEYTLRQLYQTRENNKEKNEWINMLNAKNGLLILLVLFDSEALYFPKPYCLLSFLLFTLHNLTVRTYCWTYLTLSHRTCRNQTDTNLPSQLG